MRTGFALRLAGNGALLALLVAGCSGKPETGRATPSEAKSSAVPATAAQGVVDSVRERFRLKSEIDDPSGVTSQQETPVLGDAVADRVDRDGVWLRPHIPDTKAKVIHPARVTLPSKANGAFELRDKDTGMWIEVALEGAQDVEGETAGGYVVYRGGYRGGAHVIHRPTAEGTEDYIVFEEAPEEPEIRYTVRLGDKVAGLRLVENVLEFLDEGGAPRLRMGAPYSFSKYGARKTENAIRLLDCPADRSPVMPWGRKTENLRRGTRCTVAIDVDACTGPECIVDPAWISTGGLAGGCWSPMSVALAGGKVLLTGGIPGVNSRRADLFDEATGTWAATANTQNDHYLGTMTLLQNGKALLVGGGNVNVNCTSEPRAEEYSPLTGTWQTTGALGDCRCRHSAVLLGDGRVLVTGSAATGNIAATASSTIYDPTSRTWTQTASMSTSRGYHSSVLMPNGTVLVAGGVQVGYNSVGTSALASSELFDPTTSLWVAAGQMTRGRSSFPLLSLPNGRVAAVSGASKEDDSVVGLPAVPDGSVDLFDPSSKTWTPGSPVGLPRARARAVILGGGGLLLTGGYGAGGTAIGEAELYDQQANSWSAAGSMVEPRNSHALTLLPSGRVLATGGSNNPQRQNWGALATAEVFGLVAGAGTCSVSGECLSGFCVDGHCCDTVCDQACYGCVAAKTGQPDGTCAPITAATDPDSDCLDSGSPTCQQNGLCDGAGACQLYSNPASCSPASSCAKNTDCTSGHCVDGVCCNTACVGPCVACTAALKGSGVDGLCGPVAADTDPDSDCAPDALYPQSCKADGMCDGAGQCRVYAVSGVSCDATVGECENGMVISAAECNGAGTCLGKPKSCAPYTCQDATACATSCVTDAQCADNAWCQTSDGTCLPDQDNGASCTSGSQCVSGNCVDGLCCDTACDTTCMACKAVHQAGIGQDGHCAPVKEGIDPYSACPEDGLTSCKRDGECDGFGACRRYIQGTACGPTQCVGNDIKGQICDGLGNCIVESNGVTCGPYLCSGSTCTNPCGSDMQCQSGYWCDTGTCRAKGAPGVACSAPNQCQGGNCVDAVCCDVACSDPCLACAAALKQSGDLSGTCGPAKNGEDPHDDCPAEAATTCGLDGWCDGFGACRQYGQGTTCGDSQCVKDSVKAKICDGHGGCALEPVAHGCGDYTCLAGACMSSCSDDAECAENRYCDTSKSECTGKFTPGTPCSSALQCLSGNCADGVCCDTECNGQCESCALSGSEGVCSPVLGDPKPGHPECKGAPGEACSGTCDGKYRQECRYPQAGTPCGSLCNGGAETTSVCSGLGACQIGTTKTCDPYVCDGSVRCKTSCTSNADCSTGNACGPDGTCGPNVATCDGDHTLVTSDGNQADCSPYKCQTGGLCRDTCDSSNDCVSPALCDRTGHCVPPEAAEAATDSGGCGCHVGDSGAASYGWAGALIAMGLWAERRRRERQPRRKTRRGG